MVLQAAAKTASSMKEMRNFAKHRKGTETDPKKKPALGTGKHSQKGGKEIPENELEIKLAENEFRRRQWLMQWQMEVVDMQNELYEMEQSLANSLVRSESAKARDHATKKEASKPQMTEEELQKLPIRMRPKPKYEPYTTERERTEINTKSYEKVIQNLVDHPRKFDVLSPDISSDNKGFPEIAAGQSEHFKVLLMKNRFYRYRERDDMLLSLKMEPAWARGLAPKTLVVSARSDDPTTSLPSIRASSMMNIRDASQLSSRGHDKSVRFSGSHDQLPAIVAKTPNEKANTQNIVYKTNATPKSETRLPTVSEKDKTKSTDKAGVQKVSKPRPSTSTGSPSIKSGKTSPTHSLTSFSDSNSDMGGVKEQRKKVEKEKASMPKLHKKQELNLLENAEFRRNLLNELDNKRLARIESSKWGLVKNTFKASGRLKLQMPDVIREASMSKHHNRAIEQVQERIKQRGSKENQQNMNETSNLLGSKRMSQSMPVLAK